MCVSGPDGVLMVFAWDVRLIVLSVAVAIVGSFAALECAARLRLAEQAGLRRRRFSLLGAGLMGLAIWTMHFVGMLALHMPTRVSYSPGWSLLSILAAAIGAGLAFMLINQRQIGAFHIVLGGVAMGLAIAGMHYLGMKSLHMGATIDFEPVRFFLSIAIAVGASAGALAIAYWLPASTRWAFTMRAGSAIVMGVAIAGMHYMGMAAARYRANEPGATEFADPSVGSLPLRDVVGMAGIVFAGALIALTTRSAIDRQRALQAYQQLAAELEERVRARTAELETMNNDLSAFTYTVSHDLRSPLRTIGGFTDILRESHADEFSAETRSYLERIHKAALRMDALLSGLLTLAHIARANLSRAEVDLTQLGRGIVADLAAHDPRPFAQVLVADGLRAYADTTLMTSVLQNLLHNAWKFSAKSQPSRVEFGTDRRNGEQVFFVRDNGVGFDMAHSGKLFGMFERLHHAGEFPGHGIGLAIAKRIIERHGGKIWAESRLGEGTTFYFTLG